MFLEYMSAMSKYFIIILSICVIVRCIRSMLSDHLQDEVWGYLIYGKQKLPIKHWENIIGRGSTADIRINLRGINKTHAIFMRRDTGEWRIHDVFSKGGVWVNGFKVGPEGYPVRDSDAINLAGHMLTFKVITTETRRRLESGRLAAGKRVRPGVTLFELSVIQLFFIVQFIMSAEHDNVYIIGMSFIYIMLLEWILFFSMKVMNRSGFEAETLAFFLTTLGHAVAASSVPEDLFKQLILITVSVVLFVFLGAWIRQLDRTARSRKVFAVVSLALLAVNMAAGQTILGARNWLEIGGISFQPSELVKVGYIFCGAATMERLYSRKNLFAFIVFSAICVGALALIGDFGTALIFFVTFLIISYMRSGSIATVLLAVTGAVLSAILVLTVKPYIASRFEIWGHVWEDVSDKGYQQTRALSAAASGGLFGKGLGKGWLTGIFAADTDMVFAVLCEELGLIVAVCAVFAIITLAFFALRSAAHGRSSFYSIAAVAAAAMMMVQMSMNMFGSLDILPFTGVTFPFVSRGGTSLMSCWMMIAYMKGTDTRKGSSFAVKPVSVVPEKAAPTPAMIYQNGAAAYAQAIPARTQTAAQPGAQSPEAPAAAEQNYMEYSYDSYDGFDDDDGEPAFYTEDMQ